MVSRGTTSRSSAGAAAPVPVYRVVQPRLETPASRLDEGTGGVRLRAKLCHVIAGERVDAGRQTVLGEARGEVDGEQLARVPRAECLQYHVLLGNPSSHAPVQIRAEPRTPQTWEDAGHDQ